MGRPEPAQRLALRNGSCSLLLTPGGLRALREFHRGTAASARTKYAEMFLDGEGADRGFTAFAGTASQQRFVHFAGSRAGDAVVEVGAGTGQLTFEGGLADAVGRGGLVLATDPSVPWLRVLQRKADERDARSVHALIAPAEAIPVADGQADLVLGSKFLHYCEDKLATVREMARVVRPGGTVAVLAATGGQLGGGWMRVVAPLLAAGRRHGGQGAARSLTHGPGEVGQTLREAGLRDIVVLPLTEQSLCLDYTTTMRWVAQLGMVEGFVASMPDERERKVLIEAAYADIERMFAETEPDERSFSYSFELVRGQRPAG